MPSYDVLIAGAGPIGLFLACELALRNVSVLVLERDTNPTNAWTEPMGLRGLNTPSAEAFYRRGLLAGVCDTDVAGQPKHAATEVEKGQRAGANPGFKFGGHFAGLFLDARKLDLTRLPYVLQSPALSPRPTSIEKVEKVLVKRAEELGVEIRRGCGVTRLVDHDDSRITVEAGDEKERFTAKWLVGCDGGRSVVRRAAGFDFEGTEPTFTGYIAHCEWQSDKIKPGWHYTDRGMYTIRPVGASKMLYLVDFDGGAYDRTQEVSKDHLQSVLRCISADEDITITTIHLASTFTDRCKQATTYRKGRVLLAGDAAHIHSPLGAQGLNLGIGDAMNLGWKLAATIHQETKMGSSDFGILDTYTTERHPIGAWVLEWQRAQVAIIKPDPWGAAQRRLIQQLIDTPDGANFFIERFWGLGDSQKYDLSDEHPLVGGSCPDFELEDGSRIGTKMLDGKALLIDFRNDHQLKEVVQGLEREPEVRYIAISVKDSLGLAALLARPDGVVAWVAAKGDGLDVAGLAVAMERWSW